MSVTAFATSNSEANTDFVYIETDDPDIVLLISMNSQVAQSDYKTKSYTLSGSFYNNNSEEIVANIEFTAEFSYDGSICNTLKCEPQVGGVVDGYRVEADSSSEQISPTYAKAYCYFKLYKTGLLWDTLKSSCTAIIYCNQNGELAAEWN